MPIYDDLEKKVVLLTGGANGIGASTVRAFAAQGARVFFCDRDQSAGRKLEESVSGSCFSRVNLTREHEVVRWVGSVKKREREIHVLVNNAAVDPRIPLSQLTVDKLDWLFAVNLRPFFLTARECAP